MPATITKVNPKSVLASIDDAVYDREHGQATLRYPAGRLIKAPRLNAFKAWTVNNGVMPLELERGVARVRLRGEPVRMLSKNFQTNYQLDVD